MPVADPGCRPRPARRRSRPGARGRPESEPDDVGRPRLDRPDVVRSRRAHRHHHDHEGALRAARRHGEADARQCHGAVAGGVLVHGQGRPELRVRAAQGRRLPQRRSLDRGGREVQLRALPRRRRQAPEGPGVGGGDRRLSPGALPAEGAVAGFPDVLRHARHRSRLDRAEEVRREGRRRGLQEGAGRGRAVQARVVQPRHRAGLRGPRPLLAQGACRSSAWCGRSCPRT